ncbi:hypothetical protein ABH897_003613 [Paenibacillus sp. RC73]
MYKENGEDGLVLYKPSGRFGSTIRLRSGSSIYIFDLLISSSTAL